MRSMILAVACVVCTGFTGCTGPLTRTEDVLAPDRLSVAYGEGEQDFHVFDNWSPTDQEEWRIALEWDLRRLWLDDANNPDLATIDMRNAMEGLLAEGIADGTFGTPSSFPPANTEVPFVGPERPSKPSKLYPIMSAIEWVGGLAWQYQTGGVLGLLGAALGATPKGRGVVKGIAKRAPSVRRRKKKGSDTDG